MTGPDANASSPGPPAAAEPATARIRRLLAQQVGLRLAGAESAKLERRLADRAQRRSLSLSQYCAQLSDRELAREIEQAAIDLTPGETYFLRDHGQFHLLRFHILPELIQARRGRRTLRLWSAGCATGEEAYSLALLVDEVLPERRDWQVTIIGSDINEEFLARAARGHYGSWSFRQVPAALRDRHFHRRGDHWIVNESIRRMVSFRRCNLVADSLPAPLLRDMDLILCRNVLIYFQPEAVRLVSGKLAACLVPGGFLLAGHTELMGVQVPGLARRLFPEGLVHQRQAQPLPQDSPANLAPPEVSAPRPAARPPAPPPALAPAPIPCPPLEAARESADRGDYGTAENACRQALDSAPLDPAPHFLLAQLAQLRGDYRLAEEQLKRTLYLDTGCVAAHLELAALHERSGDDGQAQARRRAALDLLRRLPAGATVEPFGASAGQLADWLSRTEVL